MPHVLIVEDDENDAFFIQRAFAQSGIDRLAHICPSAQEAMHYLEAAGPYADRERFPFPTVLVTDLKMPGLSGMDLLRWIKARPDLRVIPTIVLSSSKLPNDVKCAYCLGANAYLTKTNSNVDFSILITRLLQFWALCEVPAPDTPSCEELLAGADKCW